MPPGSEPRAPLRALVVDDDRSVRTALTINLSKAGYGVQVAASGEEALDLLRQAPVDILLTDVKMGGMTGLELLSHVRRHWPDTRIIVMTGFGTVKDAVAAMKAGASDYVIKPIEKEELLLLLERALETRAMQRELDRLRKEVDARYGLDGIIGASQAMVEVYEQIQAVADSNALVLITGETGTGKELIAHAIHYRSRRAKAPLIAVNCGALPESLLESELFGHERGAFTGAVRQHPGKFEQADGGTLFLDEIGEMPPSTQVKLLRALEGSITRVGGEQPLRVDVRVLCATNRDLWKEVQSRALRADLYYRLNVIQIRLPPLRERRDDLPLLAAHFLRRFAERHHRPLPSLSPEALRQLQSYDWPGNVRELEHLIERTVLLSAQPEIARLRMPDAATRPDPAPAPEQDPLAGIGAGGLPAALEEAERRMIRAALEEAGGVQAQAARRLGVSRSNLNYRISKLGITLQDIRFE